MRPSKDPVSKNHRSSVLDWTSADLVFEAQSRLTWDGEPILRRVRCEPLNGSLRLSGYLPSHELRETAVRIVSEVEGIPPILDEIEVVPPRARSEAAERYSGFAYQELCGQMVF